MKPYRTFILVFTLVHGVATVVTGFSAEQADRQRRLTGSTAPHHDESAVALIARALAFPVPQVAPWLFVTPVIGRFWFVINGALWGTVLVGAHLVWVRVRDGRRAPPSTA